MKLSLPQYPHLTLLLPKMLALDSMQVAFTILLNETWQKQKHVIAHIREGQVTDKELKCCDGSTD